jgi:hypothetical protein
MTTIAAIMRKNAAKARWRERRLLAGETERNFRGGARWRPMIAGRI